MILGTVQKNAFILLMNYKLKEEKMQYSNGFIKYYIKDENLYLETIYIEENKRKQGFGTVYLKEFIKKYNNLYNIYTFASNELGTDINVLFKWYYKLGFKKCNLNIRGLDNINLCLERVRRI